MLKKKIDIKASIAADYALFGLGWLIALTTFNNFIGGVFMALLDPLRSGAVQCGVVGCDACITSTGFIAGGMVVAKKVWAKTRSIVYCLQILPLARVGLLFAAREWAWLFVVGMYVYIK